MTDGCEHTTSGDTPERRGLISPSSEVWHSEPPAMGLRQARDTKIDNVPVRRQVLRQPNTLTDRCLTRNCGDGAERRACFPDMFYDILRALERFSSACSLTREADETYGR